MKTYEIEYITGTGIKGVTTVNAGCKTEAYLSFVKAYPIDYTITGMKKIKGFDIITMVSKSNKHTVYCDGKKRTFNTLKCALIYIKILHEKGAVSNVF